MFRQQRQLRSLSEHLDAFAQAVPAGQTPNLERRTCMQVSNTPQQGRLYMAHADKGSSWENLGCKRHRLQPGSEYLCRVHVVAPSARLSLVYQSSLECSSPGEDETARGPCTLQGKSYTFHVLKTNRQKIRDRRQRDTCQAIVMRLLWKLDTICNQRMHEARLTLLRVVHWRCGQ